MSRSRRECPPEKRRHFDVLRNRDYHALEDLDPLQKVIEEQDYLMRVRYENGLVDTGVRAPDFDFPFDVPLHAQFH